MVHGGAVLLSPSFCRGRVPFFRSWFAHGATLSSSVFSLFLFSRCSKASERSPVRAFFIISAILMPPPPPPPLRLLGAGAAFFFPKVLVFSCFLEGGVEVVTVVVGERVGRGGAAVLVAGGDKPK